MTAVPLTFSRNALREIDRRCVEQFHLPILVLMENAGRAVAEAALKLSAPKANILILAGPGNNGADGMVAARHLHNAGRNVTILLLAHREAYHNAANAQLQILEAMNIPIQILSPGHPEFRDWLVDSAPHDLLIDALFGTGLARPIQTPAADLINAANHSHRPILAIDIPSGIDADTGQVLGAAIQATQTLSFCGQKKGFPTAQKYTGKITTADIGAPKELLTELAEP